MNVEQFMKGTGAGGEALARAAWDQAVALIKAALPEHHAAIDAALAAEPEIVNVNASDGGHAAEGTQ
jgi:hypothetical protein